MANRLLEVITLCNTDDELSCCIPEMYVNKKVINIFIGRRYVCMIIIYIYISGHKHLHNYITLKAIYLIEE